MKISEIVKKESIVKKEDYYHQEFYNLSYSTFYWSSSESGGLAWGRTLYYYSPKVYRSPYDKALGFSVRCVQD